MGIVTSLLRGPAPLAYGPAHDFWYSPVGLASQTGVTVTADTAMKASAVWACVRLISETVAALPLFVYRRLPDGGRERAPEHPLSRLLAEPNGEQTALDFVEMMTSHALLRPYGYARIVPGPDGPFGALVPLHPDQVTPERLSDSRRRYRVRQPNGTEETFNSEDIFRYGTGLSVIEYARESVGLALATEWYGARVFSQSGRPTGGILEHPGVLGVEASQRVQADWQAARAGLANAHRTAILEEGMKYHEVGMSSEDAQYLQTREFQVADIARWFRVPLHMIGETARTTSWGSGIEQLSIGFVVYTLLPWLKRWEQTIARMLLFDPETYFVSFVVDGLLRGDTKSRYEAYAIARTWGWMSVNDVRRLENQNPIATGDVYLQPLNMVEAGRIPAAPPPAGTSGADHHHLLVRDAAARIVRKEIAALGKAARRSASDPEAWHRAVEEFYADHAAYIIQTLRISRADADSYVAEQRAALVAYGAAELTDWETRRVDDLVALVLKEGASDEPSATAELSTL